MKRNKTIIVLLLITTFLVGCNKNPSESEDISSTSLSDVSSEVVSDDTTESELSTELSSEEVSSEGISSSEVSSVEISSETPSSEAPSSESVPVSSEVAGNFPATPVGIEVPAAVFTYYTSVNFNTTGNTLKGELYNKIKGHTSTSYSGLNTTMRTTDRDWNLSPDPNDTNPYMVLIYASYNFNTASAQRYNTRNTVWDKEHIWAKSHGGFSDSPPAGSDMHHLRASDKNNNNRRGTYDFGYVTGSVTNIKDYKNNNSGKLGSSSKGGTVYEPLDHYKGDVARAMFYMATRYSSFETGFSAPHRNLALVDYITSTSSGNGKFGLISDLLRWHAEDPVDEFEFNRNGLVQDYQKNRNPYIDFPELAAKVFG